MFEMNTMGPFLVATFTLLVVPGPSVVFVVTQALTHGRTAGLVSVAGLEAGLLVHVAAAAAGLSALAASSAVAMTTLRVTGAAYLLLLAARPLFERRAGAAPGAAPEAAKETAKGTVRGVPVGRTRPENWSLARDAFFVDLLNPQSLLFFLAFLPQFVDLRRGAPTGQLLVLGASVVLLALVCDAAYVVVSTALAARRSRTRVRWDSTASRRATGVTSAMYVSLAVWATIS